MFKKLTGQVDCFRFNNDIYRINSLKCSGYLSGTHGESCKLPRDTIWQRKIFLRITMHVCYLTRAAVAFSCIIKFKKTLKREQDAGCIYFKSLK